MARYQLITGSLLLLAIVVAQSTAEAPRRLRFNPRQRQTFARQEVEVPPTPYPSAAELKPEEPALIYGPPPSTDVNELPGEEEIPVNSFQPDAQPESDPEPTDEADEVDTEESSLEVTTPAPSARLRLRSSRQRLAKLKLKQTKQIKRQRIARLEELPIAAAPVAAASVPAAVPAPQFYYINAQQQPYLVALNGQQLSW